MWEENVGKVKARRSKNSKPYERPKSILRRVTDSVTGLLPQPSWLVNWLQSTSPEKEHNENEEIEQEQPVPSTSSASNGSSSYQEGVERESFIFRRPPGTSREQSNVSAVPNVPAMDLFPEPAVGESTLKEQLIQTNGDDDSNSESTSGCSSLLPHPEHKRENRNVELPILNIVEPLSINQSSLQIIGSSLSKSLAVDLKNSRGRKTLSLHAFGQESNLSITPAEESRFPKAMDETGTSFFDKEDTSINRSASKRDISHPQLSFFGSKRPRFNVTSFGPTAAEARRSLLNDSVVDSPFYAGRTTYGGASAYRRAALQPSTTLFPYVRNRIQARPSSVSSAPPTPSGNVHTTASSSNVLLSSSAQRILQALEAMSTPVRDAKRIPAASSSSRRSSSMHDEELSFTGFGLSRRRPNLGPPTSKLSVGTPTQIVARQVPTSIHSLESAPVSSTPISTQAGGKMRMRTSAPVRKSAPRIQEDEEEDLEILTAVAMPISITSLPSFNLLPPLSVGPTETVASSSGKTLACAATSRNGLEASAVVSVSRPTFTFSAPLVTVSPYEAETAASSKPPSFNFSSPLLVKPATGKASEKQPVQPMEFNLKSGSVLEVLRGKTQEAAPVTETVPTTPPSGFGDKFKPPSDSWTCPVCCVTNPKDKTSCLACESPAVATKPAITVPIAPKPLTTGFGDQFKMSSAQWECSVCMVRNADKDNRCKSCEEPQPGSKPAITPSAISTFKFGIQTAQTSTKIGKESSTLSQPPGFLFGLSSKKEDFSAGFKFGVPAEASKEVKETPGFKFGNTIEPKKIEALSTDASVEPTSTEKGGFKCSVSVEPSRKTEEPVRGFKFGTDKKTEETNVITATVGVSSESAISPTQLFGFKAAEPIMKKAEETNIPTSNSLVKPETEPLVFKVPALFPQATTGMSVASTSTTSASKASPIFSFGESPVIPDSRSSVIETGSVMDVLGKKPAAPVIVGPVSSAPTFSFGASDQTKSLFSFGSTEKSTLKLGSGTTEKVAGTCKSLASTTTSASFDFAKGSTPTSSESLFKPTAAPSFNFGAQTAVVLPTFGVPSTTTATSAFGLKTGTVPPTSFGLPSASAVFGVPAPAPPTFGLPVSLAVPTTFDLPTTSAAPAAFGLSTTSAVTTSTVGLVAPASSVFTFGSTTGATTTSASSSTFSFGMAPSSSKATFSFGTSAPPPYQFPKETPKLASGFGFGVPATGVATSATPAGSLFSFGSSNVPSAATPTASEAPQMQFNFGISHETATSTASTFGSFGGSATTQTTAAPFMGFNSSTSSTPAFGEMTRKPSGTPFGATPFGSLPSTGFGAPAPSASSASPFSFGAQPAAAAAAAAPPPPPAAFNAGSSFNFGAPAVSASMAPSPQQPSALFQFGTAPTSAVNSGFNFASSPGFTTPDAPSPGFASGFLGANPFDNTGSAGGPSRKIRKAVRRR